MLEDDIRFLEVEACASKDDKVLEETDIGIKVADKREMFSCDIRIVLAALS